MLVPYKASFLPTSHLLQLGPWRLQSVQPLETVVEEGAVQGEAHNSKSARLHPVPVLRRDDLMPLS